MKSIETFAVLICAVLISFCDAQLGASCHAPILTPRKNLDLGRFSGTWHMMKYAPNLAELVQPLTFTCLSQVYRTTNDSQTLELTNSFIRLNGSLGGGDTPAHIDDPNVPALWSIQENGLNFTVMVLSTDYDNWAFLYGCTILNNIRMELGIIHSRQRTLNAVHQNFLDSLLVGLGFPETSHLVVTQTNCENSPVHDRREHE